MKELRYQKILFYATFSNSPANQQKNINSITFANQNSHICTKTYLKNYGQASHTPQNNLSMTLPEAKKIKSNSSIRSLRSHQSKLLNQLDQICNFYIYQHQMYGDKHQHCSQTTRLVPNQQNYYTQLQSKESISPKKQIRQDQHQKIRMASLIQQTQPLTLQKIIMQEQKNKQIQLSAPSLGKALILTDQSQNKITSNIIISLHSLSTVILLKCLTKCNDGDDKIGLLKQSSTNFYHLAFPIKQKENDPFSRARKLEKILINTFEIQYDFDLETVFEFFRKKCFKNRLLTLWNYDKEQFGPVEIQYIKKQLKKHQIDFISVGDECLVLVNNLKKNEKNSNWSTEQKFLLQKSLENHQSDQLFLEEFQQIDNISANLSSFLELQKIEENAKHTTIYKIIQYLQQHQSICSFIFDLTQSVNPRLSINFTHQQDKLQFIIDYQQYFQKKLLSFTYEKTKEIIELSARQFRQLQAQILQNNAYYGRTKGKPIDNMSSRKVDLELNFVQHSKSMIKQANKAMKANSLYALQYLWDQNLYSTVTFILKNGQFFQKQFQKQMIIFTRLAQYKLIRFQYGNISLFKIMYNGIDKLVQSLLAFYELNPIPPKQIFDSQKCQESKMAQQIRSSLKISEHNITPRALDRYYQNQLIGEQKPVIRVLNNNVQELNSLTKGTLLFLKQFQQIRDIFNILTYQGHKILSKYHYENYHLKNKNTNQFCRKIHQEAITEHKCLGCSTFFYKDMNIIDSSINEVPVTVFNDIRQARQHQNQIKDIICAMLNSGGGIILFNCEHLHQLQLAKGSFMTEKDKDAYQQKLESYLSCFYPREEAKQSVSISFVPIIENPSLHRSTGRKEGYRGDQFYLKKEIKFNQRGFIQGTYITRIKINPISSFLLFLWKSDNNERIQDNNYICSVMKEGTNKTIKANNIRQIIKQKIKKHYLPAALTVKEKKLFRNKQSYFNHRCPYPLPGIPSHIDEQRQIRFLKQPNRYNPFTYASLVVIQKKNIPLLKQLFKTHKKRVEIVIKFSQYCFQNSRNTALLYHDDKFQELIRVTKQNRDFYFNNKMLIIIRITQYLKLIHRNQDNIMSKQSFRIFQEIFKKQFQETPKMFEFTTPSNKEYYIQCQSHQSTLLAYYYLNHYRQKTLFKNPDNFDKYSQQEKQKYWKELYPEEKQSDPFFFQRKSTPQKEVNNQNQFNQTQDTTLTQNIDLTNQSELTPSVIY